MLMPTRRLLLPLMTAAVAASPVLAAPASRSVDAPSTVQSVPVAPASQASGSLVLKLRRSPTTVDLLIEGAGSSPTLSQGGMGGTWTGQLRTATPTGLRLGPQRISLPEAGLQSVSLSGSGSSYQLQVVPSPGLPLSRPVVSADGENLIISFQSPVGDSSQSSARLDLRQPGTVPQPSYAPPLQPRAVAPPLGDMAVGSMVLRNQSFVNAPGPNVTLTLRNAPAKDALMAIAQLGGYGFVFVDDSGSAAAAAPSAGANRQVTISFRNESYAKALNSVLLSAGLQGKRDGNMIIAGPNVLGKTFGPQLSKVYRLNQASASSAADYLASLGASITKVNIITNSVTQGTPQANEIAGGSATQQTQTQRITTTETYGGGAGPLKGLTGTTDSRLQTITLIGDSALVSIAESYLRQLDLRQRQVALSVRILDISLENQADIANSFSYRWGNNFIVNDNGTLAGIFGSRVPANVGPLSGVVTPGGTSAGMSYPKDNFYDYIRARIESSSTKLIASPTLILQENSDDLASGRARDSGSGNSDGGLDAYNIDSPIGRQFANEAMVRVGVNVPSDVEVVENSQTGTTSCQISGFTTAGLVLGARVSKIDDNGFVSFSLSPSVSAVTDQISSGGNCPDINILSVRRLDSGLLRVRSGQTLVMTGVISDFDRQEVAKWPILGDMPLIGQFFRSSLRSREKRELVILVTPKIINDSDGGVYGYGYQPSSDASRDFVNSPYTSN